jgi:glycosyltransferase involved in cell wall biosynthesis
VRFHIVTPSYNQLEFLKRCIASVADQVSETIQVRHHIQDGDSTDGTREYLAEHESKSCQLSANGYMFSYDSTADEGMYDAINRGWRLAGEDVDVIAHLNCDEQYLPGALQSIADYFSSNRDVDVALADMIVVDREGDYVCHRRSLKPYALFSRICCVGMTTTTFQRASVVRDKHVLFDTSWRNIGDMVWYNALHKAGVCFGVCNELVSIFTDTGENLNLTEEAICERKRYADEYLFGTRSFTRMISKFYSLRRYLKEFGMEPPKQYAFYWYADRDREVRPIQKPTALWHRSGPEKILASLNKS